MTHIRAFFRHNAIRTGVQTIFVSTIIFMVLLTAPVIMSLV